MLAAMRSTSFTRSSIRVLCSVGNCSRLLSSCVERTTPNLPVKLSDEVMSAIKSNVPIVALESTIISHGMPYPRNFDLARDVEHAVRAAGAVPATVAIINGVPKVGVSEEELLLLSQDNTDVIKASTRDLSYSIVRKMTAATTVAATMKLSHLAGVSVFATGGTGGVHRGAEISMDISADLMELHRTPVTVVSAGVKSILDIAKTLEVLETLSVPVFGYQSPIFPAFYTNDSGIRSPLEAQNAQDIARVMIEQRQLQLSNGILVGVPNPSPMGNSASLQYAIEEALHEVEEQGITGAAITPFVLARVKNNTDGLSLEANVQLMLNNAQVAAQIAIEYSKLSAELDSQLRLGGSQLQQTPPACSSHFVSAAYTLDSPVQKQNWQPLVQQNTALSDTSNDAKSNLADHTAKFSIPVKTADGSGDAGAGLSSGELVNKPVREVVVVGGAVVDFIGTISSAPMYGSSNPGAIIMRNGGVGRNVAESICLLNLSPTAAFASSLETPSTTEGANDKVRAMLVSIVADDDRGVDLLKHAEECGIDTSLVKVLPSQGFPYAYAEESSLLTKADAEIGVNKITSHASDSVGKKSVDTNNTSYVDSSTFCYVTSQPETPIATYSQEQDQNKEQGPPYRTATYSAIHNRQGDLCIGISDTKILKQLDAQYIESIRGSIKQSMVVVSDGNITPEAFRAVAAVCSHWNKALVFEPTSNHKCLLPLLADRMHQVDMIKPNISELVALIQYGLKKGMISTGRALVQTSLHNLSLAVRHMAFAERTGQEKIDVAAAAEESEEYGQEGEEGVVDDTDVRVLATALHHIMSAGRNSATSSHIRATSTSTGSYGADGGGRSETELGVTLEGNVITGKHIVVSLGANGVLWCGPKKCIATATSSPLFVPGSLIMDDARDFASCKLAALALGKENLCHTNGAGDSLCAGIVAHVVRKAQHWARQQQPLPQVVDSLGSNVQTLEPLPNAECIEAGIRNAHSWLTSSTMYKQ